jgi:hypothetical protein
MRKMRQVLPTLKHYKFIFLIWARSWRNAFFLSICFSPPVKLLIILYFSSWIIFNIKNSFKFVDSLSYKSIINFYFIFRCDSRFFHQKIRFLFHFLVITPILASLDFYFIFSSFGFFYRVSSYFGNTLLFLKQSIFFWQENDISIQTYKRL